MTNTSLFLDFESNKAKNYYIAGKKINGDFEQVILDKRLSGLAISKNFRQMCVQDFLEQICEEYDELTVYGYSEHERNVFKELITKPSLRKTNFNYVNLLKAAKSWINKCRKVEFEKLPPFRLNANSYQAKKLKNSLASIMRLTPFQSRSDYAPGRTTKRFNMGIKGLEKHNQDYEKLTKSQKRDLTQALSHNKFDVCALPILLKRILDEHPKALDKATKHLFEQ